MKPPTISTTICISVGVGALALIVFSYYRKNKRKCQMSPQSAKWQKIGTLKEIDLYPIKSSSAVLINEAYCDEFGLSANNVHDRNLVIIDESDDRIASVGRFPSMLSIKFDIKSNGVLSLSAPNQSTITLDLNSLREQSRSQRIMKEKGFSLHLNEFQPMHHAWISRAILKKDAGMRLYLADYVMDTSWWRSIKTEFVPVMVMHDKSVSDLNLRIAANKPIHHLQFRGNLLIESLDGVAPFDEDKWLNLKIGNDAENCVILSNGVACFRCIIPNIDVDTCERRADFEPLKTMKSFRLRGNPKDPEMGIYFNVFKTGHLKCGDAVYVQYK